MGLLIVCKRKSLASLLPPSRSRSLLPLSENTPYGSVAPSLLPSPHSSLCGSQRKNTMSPALELSTANASNFIIYFLSIRFIFSQLLNFFFLKKKKKKKKKK